MARKSTHPPPQRLVKTPEQIQQGIARLQRRIADVEAFQPESVKERWAPETKAIEASISDTLDAVFGHNTQRHSRFSGAADLDKGGLVLGGGSDPLFKVHQWLQEGKADSLALLRQAVSSLEEDLAELGAGTGISDREDTAQVRRMADDQVFIVHGRDGPAKVEVARLIERAGLSAVILHEQPNQGRTIIEKFEHHGGSVGFAVIVLTPDDVGGLNDQNLAPRARQNVIGEMFWFAAKLGRDRVCALKRANIELPSDFAGVGYTDMDDRGAWKAELLRELQAAGYVVDWGKALA